LEINRPAAFGEVPEPAGANERTEPFGKIYNHRKKNLILADENPIVVMRSETIYYYYKSQTSVAIVVKTSGFWRLSRC
jgi:hypothetical protein